MNLELYSDPVWGLGGRAGIRYDDALRAVAYDEELVKPAVLLADRVTLRTHRLDLRNAAVIGANSIRYEARRAGIMQGFAEGQPGWTYDAAGITEILDDLRQAVDEHMGQDDLVSIEVAFTDVGLEFGRRMHEFHKVAYEELAAPSFKALIDSGVLTEHPWDQRDYSAMSIPEASFENRENAFMVGFSRLLEEIDSGSAPLMIDRGVGDRLVQWDPNLSVPSAETLRNAADLLRVVDAISAAPLDAVADVREELAQYVAPFRRFIVSQAQALDLPDSIGLGERQRALAQHWDSEVAPAIDDLRAHVTSNSFARNLFKVSLDKSESTLAVGMGIVGSVSANALGFAALGGAGLAAVPILAGAVRAKVDADRDARANPVYFIYQLEQRLRDRGVLA